MAADILSFPNRGGEGFRFKGKIGDADFAKVLTMPLRSSRDTLIAEAIEQIEQAKRRYNYLRYDAGRRRVVKAALDWWKAELRTLQSRCG